MTNCSHEVISGQIDFQEGARKKVTCIDTDSVPIVMISSGIASVCYHHLSRSAKEDI